RGRFGRPRTRPGPLAVRGRAAPDRPGALLHLRAEQHAAVAAGRTRGAMSTTMSSTIRVTLPDASVREVPAGTTSRQIAEAIGPGLARAALAARVNGAVWDLDRPLDADATLAILTE